MTHVRLDVFPDGGLARLRVNGEVDAAALHAAGGPLAGPAAGAPRGPGPRRPVAGLSAEEAEALVGKRPFGDGAVPDEVVTALLAD